MDWSRHGNIKANRIFLLDGDNFTDIGFIKTGLGMQEE